MFRDEFLLELRPFACRHPAQDNIAAQLWDRHGLRRHLSRRQKHFACERHRIWSLSVMREIAPYVELVRRLSVPQTSGPAVPRSASATSPPVSTKSPSICTWPCHSGFAADRTPVLDRRTNGTPDVPDELSSVFSTVLTPATIDDP